MCMRSELDFASLLRKKYLSVRLIVLRLYFLPTTYMWWEPIFADRKSFSKAESFLRAGKWSTLNTGACSRESGLTLEQIQRNVFKNFFGCKSKPRSRQYPIKINYDKFIMTTGKLAIKRNEHSPPQLWINLIVFTY